MVVEITNAEKLPGAFLFFTVKPRNGSAFAGVAYDATISKGQDLREIVKRYLEGNGDHIPYMEKFADLGEKLTEQTVWHGTSEISYGGVFGGMDSKQRVELSEAWPYVNDVTIKGQKVQNPIKNGVYISYWNFGGNTKGIHTSSITDHFHREAVVPYMNLWPGPGGDRRNLVPNSAIIKRTVSELYLDWYATFEGDFGWSTLSFNN